MRHTGRSPALAFALAAPTLIPCQLAICSNPVSYDSSRRKLNVFRSFAFSSSLFSVFQNLGERLGHSFAYDSETMSQNGVRHRRIDVTSTEEDQGHVGWPLHARIDAEYRCTNPPASRLVCRSVRTGACFLGIQDCPFCGPSPRRRFFGNERADT